jgi:penicillin-binding protein 1A
MFSLFGKALANIIGIFLTCLAFGLLAVGLVFYHYSQDLPDYSELAHYDPDTVTRLYAGDGRLLAEYAVEKRVYVPLKAVPKRVIQAFISAEDKNFYTNNGVDLYGIARALRQNIHSFGAGGHSLSGGSTITQQVVKNFLLTPEKSIPRKIKEALLAFRITQVYSKDRILELYLNEIYLGKGSYGIAAAALNYFNKSLDELNIEEAGFLAAMPQAPGRSDPAQHYDKAKERRDWVINRMMDDSYITADEARAAIATPIILRVRDKMETASADFFAEEVRRELASSYGDDALYKGGLFVKTTLDPDLQKYADEGLRFALTEYDHRHGYRGPISHMDRLTDWQKQLKVLGGRKKLPLFDNEQLAVVLESSASKAFIGYTDGKKAMLDKASLTWTQKKGLQIGDVVIAAPSEKGLQAIHQIPEVNGAMIVMDPHTGRVLAMSGGYSYGGTEFNRATQAKRQPGSAFKPFVYLSAMESGFTPSTIVVDEPVELSQGTGMPVWRPGNYHDDYLGPSTLRTGLEKSRNTMTVKLAQILGIDKIIEVGTRFGIYDILPRQFSVVLGAQETTLVRLANAYSMIVNGGKKVSPWLIERIDDRNGKTILRRDKRECKGCKIDNLTNNIPPNPPILADDRPQLVDPRVAYQMVSMLQGVVERGTGTRAKKIGKPIAGKTGTTNDSRDTWFMGFSPDLVAGIYVGFDKPQTLGKKETGASVALPGFVKFMENALKNKPSTPFRIPPGIEFVKVNAKTGLPPLPGDTGNVILEAFKANEMPGNPANTPLNPAGLPVIPPTPGAPALLPWQQPTAPAYNFPSEVPVTPDSDPFSVLQKNNSEENDPNALPPSRYEQRRSHPAQGTGGLY